MEVVLTTKALNYLTSKGINIITIDMKDTSC